MSIQPQMEAPQFQLAEDETQAAWPEPTDNFDPNQPRDEKGQWTDEGGGGGAISSTEMGVEQAADISLPNDTKEYAYFYHAVRSDKDIDRILESGLRPKSEGGRVFLSKDEVRDLGAGFLIVRVPTGSYQEGKDMVEEGLSYREFTVDKVPPENIVRAVRMVADKTGFRIREDILAGYLASGKATKDEKEAVPEKYQHWIPTTNVTTNAPPKAFAFRTKDEKLKGFNKWFADLVNRGILEVDRQTKPWLAKYVESAYKKGAIRAYTDAHQADLGKSPDFYLGSREQFLRSAFETSERVSKMQLLGTRAFEELKGITAEMSRQMSRVLADGMAHGKGPYDIARTMSRTITGIESRRAKVIARTEIIHAHAEGQLDGFEDLGVDEVGIQAEWSTAGDDLVCALCSEREGEVMSVDEARGLIPLHPNCRCAWIPHLKKPKKGRQ